MRLCYIHTYIHGAPEGMRHWCKLILVQLSAERDKIGLELAGQLRFMCTDTQVWVNRFTAMTSFRNDQ